MWDLLHTEQQAAGQLTEKATERPMKRATEAMDDAVTGALERISEWARR